MSDWTELLRQIQASTYRPGEATPAVPQQQLTEFAMSPGVAPTSGPMVAPAQPAVPAPAPPVNGNILSTIGRILMPEGGSLWHSALNGGVYNARETQRQYGQARTAEQVAARRATAQATQAETEATRAAATANEMNIGGRRVRRNADGSYTELYAPSPTQSSDQQLLAQWQRENPGQDPSPIILRMLRGYQYTPEVIDRRTEGQVRVAQERGSQARATGVSNAAAQARYRAPARGRASGGRSGAARAAAAPRLPTGAVLLPRN